VVRPRRTRWTYTDLALCGALVGAMLVLLLNVWDILYGHFDASDPFIHVITETISFAGAGAILSVVLGMIYSLFVQRM
jgi:ABC-type Fe3+ transport system permease subunit